MPVFDHDQTVWQWIAMLLFGAPAGYKVVTHESRIKQLEEHRKDSVDPQLKTLGEGAARIESKLDAAASDLKTIVDLLIGNGINR